MSWHYLQGLAVASWADDCLDGAPDALLRLTPTLEVSCLQDRQTGTLTGSQSGTTCAPSTADRGGAKSMLLPAAFRAKTLAQRVKVKDLPAQVRDYGLKCSELLRKLGLVLSSRKTVRIYVPEGLVPSYKDLPAWGMMLDGACWGLGTSARHTGAIDSGYLLPTPTAARYGSTNNGIDTKTGKPYLTRGKMSLDSMAASGQWPDLATEKRVDRGPLNPIYIEWLMGWPIGWTDLKPLETGKFQTWRHRHLKYLATAGCERGEK